MNEIVISNTRNPLVCACDYRAAPEPSFHSDRVLEFNVLIYVTDGVIYVTEDGTDYAVHSGELLFLKNGVRHFGRTEIPKGTCWHFVHFYTENAAEARFSPDAAVLGVYENTALSAVLPKKLCGLSGTAAERKISALSELCGSDNPNKRWLANSMLSDIFNELLCFSSAEKNPQTLSDRICGWLDIHCCEPFSAARLEGEFFLSYKHLAAVFKREKELTMQQYHTSRRMSTACRLLASTVMPIGEIAERVGYSDPLYFSRCFSEMKGVSPREYRRRIKEEY